MNTKLTIFLLLIFLPLGLAAGGCNETANCDDGNACTMELCLNHTCQYESISECMDNDGCCPENCNSMNDNDCQGGSGGGGGGCGTTEEPETTCDDGLDNDCDGLIDAEDPDCIGCLSNEDCDDWDPCTFDACFDSICIHNMTTACMDDDGCCPEGCQGEDSDCNECFTDTECEDNDPCTVDACYNGLCSNEPIITCTNEDNCCPSGCTHSTDSDCEQQDECYTDSDCDDLDPCTYDMCSGTPRKCHHNVTLICENDDQCCPEGCEYAVDNDCSEPDENHPPEVYVVSPNGGEAWEGTEKITWKASDPDNEVIDYVRIEYCLSANNPNLYSQCQMITKDTSNTGTYYWDTTTVPDGAYKIRITVTDGEVWESDMSDNPFKIHNKDEIIHFEECNNGIGYSIGDSAYSEHPKYCHTGLEDCCGWYQTTHVHDMKGVIKEPVDMNIIMKPGYYDGCTSKATVSVSKDNQIWRTVGKTTLTSEDTDGEKGYPEVWKRHKLKIEDIKDFRYVRIDIPDCYNDYSSVTLSSIGPTPCIATRLDTAFKLGEDQCARIIDYDKMKIRVGEIDTDKEPSTVRLAVEKAFGQGGAGTSIVLKEGETQEVFGAEITAKAIDNDAVILKVSVEGKEIKVWLNKPFDMEEGQTARLVDYKVLTMHLDDIKLLPTYTTQVGKPEPVISKISGAVTSGSGGAIAPSSVGGSGGGGVVAKAKYVAYINVHPTLERPTIVSSEEVQKAKTTKSMTGMVVGSTVEQQENKMEVMQPIKVTSTEAERLVKREEITKSLGRRYKMLEGETIKVFGVQITLKKINSEYATFVITKETQAKTCKEACERQGYYTGRCATECSEEHIDLGTEYCTQITVPVTPDVDTPELTPGYDKSEYGGGWSEPKSNAKKCGWPPGKKGYIRDCGCCYVHTHVHDLAKTFSNEEVEIEYRPGFTKGCRSTMTVYSSVDGKEWDEIITKNVTQETWSPKTTYKDTLKVSGKFRYIKIYIPRCYNDYSSAWVTSTTKPSETTTAKAVVKTKTETLERHCCCMEKTDTVTLHIRKGWNLFSIPGEMTDLSKSGSCDTNGWRVFEYIKETNSFEPVKYPEIGKAYWVYATSECTVKGQIRSPTLLEELEELTPVWNLVPVVPEMIGKTVNELGDCEGMRAYTYHAGQWRKVNKITTSMYGHGMAVRTQSSCKLGKNDIIPPIPPFPDEEEECKDGESRKYTCENGEQVPWCACKEGHWICMISPENQCKQECREGQTKQYRCPDGTAVPWCECNKGRWSCIKSPENQCSVNQTSYCGDGICQEVTCAAVGCPEPETPENCPEDCKEEEPTECEEACLERDYQEGKCMEWVSFQSPSDFCASHEMNFLEGNYCGSNCVEGDDVSGCSSGVSDVCCCGPGVEGAN